MSSPCGTSFAVVELPAGRILSLWSDVIYLACVLCSKAQSALADKYTEAGCPEEVDVSSTFTYQPLVRL
jgi:hypothetical protein